MGRDKAKTVCDTTAQAGSQRALTSYIGRENGDTGDTVYDITARASSRRSLTG